MTRVYNLKEMYVYNMCIACFKIISEAQNTSDHRNIIVETSKRYYSADTSILQRKFLIVALFFDIMSAVGHNMHYCTHAMPCLTRGT